MDEQAKQFYEDLKKAQAEDIKGRVLKRVEEVLEESGLSKDRLKDISIDVSDYLDE